MKCWPLVFSLALCGCNHLFFFPDRQERLTPDYAELDYRDLRIPSKEGFDISGWWIPAIPPRFGTVVHFHGNAENMTTHFLFSQWLARAGYDVITFDYRGYGRTPGTADREGAMRDGRTVIDWTLAHPELGKADVFVLGQSLGGALAVAAIGEGGERGLAGLVLDSTFDSYRGIAREKLSSFWLTWPFQWPLSFLVGDHLSPVDYAGKITLPVLMLHAPADTIVEYERGKALFDAFSEPKELWTIPNGSHTSAFTDREGPWRPKLVGWLCTHGKFEKACLERRKEATRHPCPYSPDPECS